MLRINQVKVRVKQDEVAIKARTEQDEAAIKADTKQGKATIKAYAEKGQAETEINLQARQSGAEINEQARQSKAAIKAQARQDEEAIKTQVAALLHVSPQDILSIRIVRQSIDARKKPDIFYSYTLDVEVRNQERVLKRFRNKENQVALAEPETYSFPTPGNVLQTQPVVIVGMGPAGLFCGYFLALHGYQVLLLERGRCVEERQVDVERFWATGNLDPSSNVQFGEGGAGAFSDGKLNTLVKDENGRNGAVLDVLVKFGAKESIRYEAKPHLGTDVLCGIVREMRREIIRLGGEVRFSSCVTKIEIVDGKIAGVIVNDGERISCGQVVLACGHSARDTFTMLHELNVPMEPKAFAVGFRVEHSQAMINISQYGKEDPGCLGAAPYKATAKTSVGRGVYSFCMCPGGYVVNASSEEGRTVVNGMSYSDRSGKNANSAVIVSVTPEDFEADGPLAGIEFQRRLEEKAFSLGEGKIPVQRYGDFRQRVLQGGGDSTETESVIGGEETVISQKSVDRREETVIKGEKSASSEKNLTSSEESLQPQCKGDFSWADLSNILPKVCNEAFVEGMEIFSKQIKGFDRPDAILSGVESRTSSPVRICRDESLQSVIKGLYPCGEGAGYAGGITSAAMDGLRVAEAIAAEYAPTGKILK